MFYEKVLRVLMQKIYERIFSQLLCLAKVFHVYTCMIRVIVIHNNIGLYFRRRYFIDEVVVCVCDFFFLLLIEDGRKKKERNIILRLVAKLNERHKYL